MKAHLPPDEAGRLKALERYDILDSGAELEFDDITVLASHICGAPIAMISLVDEDRQWFKSKVGITESETSRDIAFCAHGILQNDMFIVEDALADKRFATNPLVTGNPRIRFYAGAPLITHDGHALGMLCVNDRVPRELSGEQKAALQALSRQVVAQLELRHTVFQLERSEKYLRMQTEVRVALAETSDSKEAVMKALGVVCEILGWDVGALWSVDRRADVLRCDEIWSAPAAQTGEFVEASRRIAFKRGEGLPGRVWASGQAAWIADVPNASNFPRAPFARNAGLRGAFGFPILSGQAVDYVVEFFSRELREPDSYLLEKFANIGGQLGQFFERKRVEEHLFQAQKMETVGKLAGGIAHEFNTVMTSIIGQSELLLVDLEQGSPFRRNAQEIRNAAERAATLTRQLLAYGRKQILRPAILDLDSLVADMEGMLRQLAGGAVDLRIVPAGEPQFVKADAGQIEQVVLNIVMNAAEAMPNGGKLTIETAGVSFDEEYVHCFPDLKPGEYVMLAITDTGAGMSAGTRARLFEPFFTTKDIGEGTGLGLAACQGIIKQSGGHVSVHSELGRGATFKVFLPRVAATPPEPAAPLQKETPARGTETVLLVDENPSLRGFAAIVLKKLGYTVHVAADAREALGIAQSTADVDLLLTDVVMPGMSGKELADRLRSSKPGVKVLFTSALTEEAIVHHGILEPGIDFLRKPYTPTLLSRKTREALDRV